VDTVNRSSSGLQNVINEQQNQISEKDKKIERLTQQVASLQQLCKDHGLISENASDGNISNIGENKI